MVDCSLVDTSRYPPDPQIYGKMGMFLYSVAALSLLEIASKPKNGTCHCSLIIRNGELLARHVQAHPEQTTSAHDHGTRVAVSDLFGSMPVRAKHRAVMLSAKVDAEKEIRRLAYRLIATLLALPISVDVTLRDLRHEKDFRLRSITNISLERRLSSLLPQIGLPSYINSTTMVPTRAESDGISISGCISLEPSATRLYQIITVGILPVINEYGYNVLFEEVNKAFASSDFGINKNDTGTDGSEKVTNRKSLEKWPVYFLQITFTNPVLGNSCDSLIDGDWRLGSLLQLLRAMCYGFLKKHHFRPKAPRKPIKRVLENENPRRSVRLAEAKELESIKEPSLSRWSHWRVGNATSTVPVEKNEKHHGSNKSSEKLVDADGRLLRLPFDVSLAGSSQAALSSSEMPTSQPGLWIQRALDTWKNPIFDLAGLQIPATDAAKGLVRSDGKDACGFDHDIGAVGLNGQLSKSALATATVIAQVDEKFILVKLPLEADGSDAIRLEASTLVLVDQHAADERCRLEDLMASYFSSSDGEPITAILEKLDTPITIEISASEARLLARRQHYLASWGISFEIVNIEVEDIMDTSTTPKPPKSAIIRVTAISPAILARCKSEANLLVGLLRSEAWKEGSTAPPSSSQCVGEPMNGHLPNFQACPRGILELLQSRSCRSRYCVRTSPRTLD